MLELDAQVLKNEQVSSSFFVLTMDAPELPKVSPGQFVQVRCRDASENAPFLRRPFSVMDQRGSEIDLVYKVIGPGTTHMSRLKAGAEVSVLGPLGKGFPSQPNSDSKTLIVAGGTGLGGIYYLAKSLAAQKQPVEILYGVRFRHEIASSLLDSLGVPYEVIIEEEHGYMTEKGLPERDLSQYARCCICGPTPMMRAVAEYVKTTVPVVEVSLEEMMGCGFGICYTCPVKRSDSEAYYGACYDGPVFQYEAIAL